MRLRKDGTGSLMRRCGRPTTRCWWRPCRAVVPFRSGRRPGWGVVLFGWDGWWFVSAQVDGRGPRQGSVFPWGVFFFEEVFFFFFWNSKGEKVLKVSAVLVACGVRACHV